MRITFIVKNLFSNTRIFFSKLLHTSTCYWLKSLFIFIWFCQRNLYNWELIFIFKFYLHFFWLLLPKLTNKFIFGCNVGSIEWERREDICQTKQLRNIKIISSVNIMIYSSYGHSEYAAAGVEMVMYLISIILLQNCLCAAFLKIACLIQICDILKLWVRMRN